MPRFFFHLSGGPKGLTLDEFGVDLPNVEDVYLEAFQAAKDMAQEWLLTGHNPRSYAFEIVNAAGELVLELPFSEALDHQAGRRPAMRPSRRMAKKQGARMMRLTAEVAQQVEMAQENVRRSQELLRGFGKDSLSRGRLLSGYQKRPSAKFLP